MPTSASFQTQRIPCRCNNWKMESISLTEKAGWAFPEAWPEEWGQEIQKYHDLQGLELLDWEETMKRIALWGA